MTNRSNLTEASFFNHRIKAKTEECKKYVDHVAKLEEQYKWVLTERDSFGQGGDFDFTKQDPKKVRVVTGNASLQV